MEFRDSQSTIIRLFLYRRCLEELLRKGRKVISSQAMAHYCGVNPAQLRKDLSFFGRFGVRGVGYNVAQLLEEIKNILGLNQQRRIALVGYNPLGETVMRYFIEPRQEYLLTAVFDYDSSRVGERVREDLLVESIESLPRVVAEKEIEIGVICTDRDQAQQAVSDLAEAGVRGILNFSPVRLNCLPHVIVQNVDFTIVLDTLTYSMSERSKRRAGRRQYNKAKQIIAAVL
ncbi:redox-sensing transcriptional repressor Rex [Thermosulfuriphilus sp.]